ncbi:Single-stranded DNA-binding protein [Komagataella phaffii CBS 7435]|uniref:Single-stranded DNA-binding protein n=2 Tax=Komagataella phaffii TaxID=460519 RepID=C4R5T0_KOMPG|nr:Single-stranded DNA-binding protein essential for mitochondrial genome maintenance [Komagataella phaffii GS115]AOA63298.1 GQ67_03977T0 [Komagataella phaffii]CAH2449273.1 Single-stranded DNA-binding protein [Komagataella phaffii CBS 7435]AOA69040.1 GQ68_03950T0 [Komagataella phaffii GS115]CAY70916.1 Single-stranded DNA-binding protein essential for mitochondrial genome maintenance [Komagataella phaffii GS115]CCA39287.1 Single-stranded DNA-binding protein [Komagataella phaffii CBS 7435]
MLPLIAKRSFHVTAAAKLAKMSIIGTIGTDLVPQETSNGKKFVKYSVAVNNKNKNGEQVTSWFNVAVFNDKQIDYMTKYLGKGVKVYVEADATNTPYEKEGIKTYSFMLFQNNIEALKYPKSQDESS